ncbi:MAG: radical SAM protein [Pseudomonadota bacterium]
MRLADKASAGLRIAACRLPWVRRPLFVGWAITNRCNLKCSYCSRPMRGSAELSTPDMLRIIDQMADCGTIRVSFTGGEPLLRDDIGRLVSRAGRCGLQVSINTNGILLADRLSEISEAREITVSLDDVEGRGAPLRKGLDLRLVTQGIRAARKRGISVTLHTVLTKHNLGEVDALLDFARRCDTGVSFTPVELQPPFEKIAQKFMPEPGALRAAVRKLMARKAGGNARIRNSMAALRYLLNWPSPNNATCCAGIMYCRIEPDGFLYPCGNLISRPQGLSCAAMGFGQAFRKLEPQRCYDCWCDTRIEMNFVYALNPGVWLDNARR